ncbi:MFS transporter [Halobacillus shinanisalinarum]|uniref:MFS transporter n=1 Tax=Halobacillus shinanisalinarum TaxID=2932258 RepID=A0ABY4H500_9BACI|nr:MFS transporter [Halobacillus shinanisalinarum]UOQ95389.1 MFS transporter [Halobacillus shinanisalinarum]
MKNTRNPIWTKSFLSISLIHFIVFITFYTLLTTLPIYVMENLGGSGAQGGLLVTMMLVAAIVVRPFSGKLLENIGKKRALYFSVILFAATTFLYMWITQYEALLALRFFHGLSFGVLTTATGAIAADVIPPERRGEGLGYFAMAMNLAVVVGPFIGLTLLQFTSFYMLFFTLSISMVIGVICSYMVHVPNQLEQSPLPARNKLSIHDLFEVKAIPIALISSLVAFAYSGIISFISVYANSLGLAAASSYFFLVFAFVMILSRPYLGRTFDVKGPNFVILPCLLIFAIGLVSLSFIQSAWGLLVSAGLIGLGYGSLLPSFQTMAIQATSDHRSGHATATFFTLYDTGIAIGSYVLGLLIAFASFSTLYIFCAVIVMIVFGLLFFQQSRQRKNKEVHSSINA